MGTPNTISPRGIPPIRPDWLVDVAWRLADHGLGRLRGWGENGQYTLEDVVDGERWRFESFRLSEFQATSVEHEADLYLPTDRDTPTLRAGFQFTPWWDEGRGRCVQARIEIGPRGAVTFDPENWFVLLPEPGTGEERPAVVGVDGGVWNTGGPAVPDGAPGIAEDLVGRAISLVDVPLVATDRTVPELLVPSYRLVPKGGLFGRGKLVPVDWPELVAHVRAEGPIEANWTGSAPLTDMADGRPVVTAVELDQGGQVTLRTESGVLTLTGPAVSLSVARPECPA